MTLIERIKKIQYFDNLRDVKVILLELVDDYLLQFLTDAPKDGNTYGRKDGSWQIVTGGGGGITSVQGGTNVTIDNTDPTSPIINVAGVADLQGVIDTGDTWTDATTTFQVSTGGILFMKDLADTAVPSILILDTDGTSTAGLQVEKIGANPSHATLQVSTPTGNCTLDSNVGLLIQNDLTKGAGSLASDYIDAGENVGLQYPNKTSGIYTIATTEDITRTISTTAPGISATIQDNRLIGATEVSLVIVNSILNQMPAFDPVTGTITQATTTSDPITIFYTKS